MCPPGRSLSLLAALRFVIERWVALDGPEQADNLLLFASLNVLIKSGGYGFLLGAVAAKFLRFVNQAVVEFEVRGDD